MHYSPLRLHFLRFHGISAPSVRTKETKLERAGVLGRLVALQPLEVALSPGPKYSKIPRTTADHKLELKPVFSWTIPSGIKGVKPILWLLRDTENLVQGLTPETLLYIYKSPPITLTRLPYLLRHTNIPAKQLTPD